MVVRAQATAQTIELCVEDSGPGIEPAVMDTLFEPFVTTKDVGKGTGLGLSVCQGIVQSWDAELSVGSSALGGASFRLVMKRAMAEER